VDGKEVTPEQLREAVGRSNDRKPNLVTRMKLRLRKALHDTHGVRGSSRQARRHPVRDTKKGPATKGASGSSKGMTTVYAECEKGMTPQDKRRKAAALAAAQAKSGAKKKVPAKQKGQGAAN
jgi:hypothetical protein